MNTEVQAEATPFDGGGRRFKGKAPLMAVFAVVGLVLLYLAVRLIRRHRPHRHHSGREAGHNR